MPQGSFTLVLHSHLPWVLHHGRWPHGVDWLNEATAETYLPLWRALHARAGRGRDLGVTLGMTPVLCEQLAHPDFHKEFVDYLEQKRKAAAADLAWFESSHERDYAALAQGWERFYRATLEDFMGPHGPNLVSRFRRLEERGAIEIITSAATHGYLPLLSSDAAVADQCRTAVAAHRRHFGRAPEGIWLPECGYRPALRGTDQRAGIEETVAAFDLRFVFVDTHMLDRGQPLGLYPHRFDARRPQVAGAVATASEPGRSPYRPYRVGDAPTVACFARDPVTAVQVWSGEQGYPGDPAYLDFHKKRFPGGHRYWSVTHAKADLADKQIYRPEAAEARIPAHATHFVSMLERTIADARRRQSSTPLVCAMFDTELFGHWWFEGPKFLGQVLDIAARHEQIEPLTAGAFLNRYPPEEHVRLPEGSWGDGGDHRVWLNDRTGWTWEIIHDSEARFERTASRAVASRSDPLLERFLAQAGRELLLLQSSDWQFLITAGTAEDYAERRLRGHAGDFDRLVDLADRRLEGGSVSSDEESFVTDCERRDSLFPDYDWRSVAREPSSGELVTGDR